IECRIKHLLISFFKFFLFCHFLYRHNINKYIIIQ
ncbi:unnamed protein product, partial [Brassica oleracea]